MVPKVGFVEVAGAALPIASMLTKSMAVAVDLVLTVAAAALALNMLSQHIALDSPAAGTPVLVVAGLAMGYLTIGRDWWLSPGRKLLRLQLARLPGNVPGLLGRRVSVHSEALPDGRNTRMQRALAVIIIGSALIGLALANAMAATGVFQQARSHLLSRPTVPGLGQPLEVATFPRAVLISAERAYVQVFAKSSEHGAVLEVFLQRAVEGHWTVLAARVAADPMLANYSLGVAFRDLPDFP
ncbi:MAG: hypothetical protein GKR94_04070 [Gammaproteobacteria bacterium]|nr:hypothetical protein [Gammaproteobacteria bacterium]